MITSYSILILDYNSYCVMSDFKLFKENTFTHPKYDRLKITQFRLMFPSSYVPQTSLSRPLWPEMSYISRDEEERQHKVVLENVNTVLAKEDYGRLFAVVHFASRQWKVTNEDLILIENRIDDECGDQIRLEVLLVGGEEFTLIGRPLLGCDLVRVEATVIEKTESWPKVHMRFWKRHRYQKKRSMYIYIYIYIYFFTC
uniref:Large ribosomal subunit protein bL21m n=1 Tax=Salmo trutta TaxID=8032 RepID=A0A673XKN8_SALTR